MVNYTELNNVLEWLFQLNIITYEDYTKLMIKAMPYLK